MTKWMYMAAVMASIAMAFSACEDSIEDDWTPSTDPTPTPTPVNPGDPTPTPDPNNTTPTPTPAPNNNSSWPTNMANVEWLHTDVSGWAETASLNVSFSGDNINLKYNKANVWPEIDGVCANPWIFVFQDGQWYAATWEWLRGGQTSKPKNVVNGPHIKRSPLENFQPVSGQIYGFMVSGLCRDDRRNVRERSNIDWVRWP